MKVLWDTKDADVGRIVYRPGCSERWFIGYIVGDIYARGNKYCLISTADGLICNIGSQADMAAHLTKFEYIPYEYKNFKQINKILPK